jgi:hypothetical protein
MAPGNEIIDKSKLTQRELLILLSDQMEGVKGDIKDFKTAIPLLDNRVTKVETKMVVVAGAFGVVSIIASIIINVFGLFK